MKTKQFVAIALFIIAAVLLIWWFSAGHQMWTTTQKLVEQKDELFGTTTRVWVNAFTPGLAPFSESQFASTGISGLFQRIVGFAGIGPLAGLGILIGIVLLVRKPKTSAA